MFGFGFSDQGACVGEELLRLGIQGYESRLDTAYSEWVSSPRGSMGSEGAEGETLGITDITEEQGCLCKRQERQKRERAK